MRIFLIAFLSLICSLAQASGGFLDGLSSITGEQKPRFLPASEAFGLTVTAVDGRALDARFKVTEDYYLYRDKISFSSNTPGIEVKTVQLPAGERKQDPTFGEVTVFFNDFQAEIILQRDNPQPQTLSLSASYMGCSKNGLCYPPETPTFEIELPAFDPSAPAPAATSAPDPAPETITADSPQSEQSRIQAMLQQGNFWLIMTFFLGAGLLLSLTPCVFPMIPILSGIIVGRGHQVTKTHAFILSLAYVLGMSITYAIAGVAAGFTGQMLSSALQTPWVVGSFAALFVILSLAMFGFYDLQLPASLQSRLTRTSNKLHGGHITGVFGMGALSAVIVGPCVAAPLAAALGYISQTEDALLGGSALFAMGLGMGAPLLLIGTSAGALLPKAGPWMEAVKQFFGVALLGLAIWMIHPFIPTSIHMLLWAVLLIFSSIYLRALDPLPHNAHGWHKLFKGLGIFSLMLGSAYLIGALSGASDMTRPLEKLGGTAQAQTSNSLSFKRIQNLDDLQQELQQANGRPVMLDFYADWCISCIEMEHETFSDPAVVQRLSSTVVLQIDVTEQNAADKAMQQHFDVFGPPVIVFFDPQGQEIPAARVTGFQDSEQFMQTLDRAGI